MATSAASLAIPRLSVPEVEPQAFRRLARKLEHHHPLSAAERDALERWLSRSMRHVRDRGTLVEQGAATSDLYIVVAGWACRYREGEGHRQVVGLLLPGDVCDFHTFVQRRADSSIEAAGDLHVACISRSALNELTAAHPRLSQGLWWDAMVAASIAREWLVNMGQRNARQRLAHLLCELHRRLSRVGLTEGARMPLPITQADLGSACGMTQEHTNRTLRDLRDAGLLALERRAVLLPDLAALEALAGFAADYLHLAEDSLAPAAFAAA